MAGLEREFNDKDGSVVGHVLLPRTRVWLDEHVVRMAMIHNRLNEAMALPFGNAWVVTLEEVCTQGGAHTVALGVCEECGFCFGSIHMFPS